MHERLWHRLPTDQSGMFCNGAQWDQPWLNKIFPGSPRFPAKPDVVVNDFAEFWALVLACRTRQASGVA